MRGAAAQAFTEAFHASPAGTRAFVFDVGANDGKWSRQWAPVARMANDSRSLHVHLIEPADCLP